MFAYSFQARFVAAIEADEKLQTIRAPRKRHARPGEQLQLYAGMRTKHCRLIARRRCLSVDPTAISIQEERVVVGSAANVSGTEPTETFLMAFDDGSAFQAKEIVDKDAFAIRDGFAGWRSMKLFWASTHPDPDKPDGWFVGVVICWTPSASRKDALPATAIVPHELEDLGIR